MPPETDLPPEHSSPEETEKVEAEAKTKESADKGIAARAKESVDGMMEDRRLEQTVGEWITGAQLRMQAVLPALTAAESTLDGLPQGSGIHIQSTWRNHLAVLRRCAERTFTDRHGVRSTGDPVAVLRHIADVAADMRLFQSQAATSNDPRFVLAAQNIGNVFSSYEQAIGQAHHLIITHRPNMPAPGRTREGQIAQTVGVMAGGALTLIAGALYFFAKDGEKNETLLLGYGLATAAMIGYGRRSPNELEPFLFQPNWRNLQLQYGLHGPDWAAFVRNYYDARTGNPDVKNFLEGRKRNDPAEVKRQRAAVLALAPAAIQPIVEFMLAGNAVDFRAMAEELNKAQSDYARRVVISHIAGPSGRITGVAALPAVVAVGAGGAAVASGVAGGPGGAPGAGPTGAVPPGPTGTPSPAGAPTGGPSGTPDPDPATAKAKIDADAKAREEAAKKDAEVKENAEMTALMERWNRNLFRIGDTATSVRNVDGTYRISAPNVSTHVYEILQKAIAAVGLTLPMEHTGTLIFTSATAANFRQLVESQESTEKRVRSAIETYNKRSDRLVTLTLVGGSFYDFRAQAVPVPPLTRENIQSTIDNGYPVGAGRSVSITGYGPDVQLLFNHNPTEIAEALDLLTSVNHYADVIRRGVRGEQSLISEYNPRVTRGSAIDTYDVEIYPTTSLRRGRVTREYVRASILHALPTHRIENTGASYLVVRGIRPDEIALFVSSVHFPSRVINETNEAYNKNPNHLCAIEPRIGTSPEQFNARITVLRRDNLDAVVKILTAQGLLFTDTGDATMSVEGLTEDTFRNLTTLLVASPAPSPTP